MELYFLFLQLKQEAIQKQGKFISRRQFKGRNIKRNSTTE
jgi:hypothetical protein